MSGLPIAATERETRISKERLRMWERRYGFPAPGRDDNGDRLYGDADIEKLKLIRLLIDRGFRPGKLVPMSTETLRELQRSNGSRDSLTRPAPTDRHQELLTLLRRGDQVLIQRWLAEELSQHGLRHMIMVSLPRIGQHIGEAWQRGELAIHEEHLYTEQVQQLLRTAMQPFYMGGRPPRVVLTTLPGEQHALGLLMAEVMLRLAQCTVMSFGTAMPLADIINAAAVHQADVVGLSISEAYGESRARQSLQILAEQLPASVGIWAGGAGMSQVQSLPERVTVVAGLGEVQTLVQRWRLERGLV